LVIGLDGMRYEDAASVLNVPLGTVRSRVARGREKLRSLTERSAAQDYRAPAGRTAANRQPLQPVPTKPFLKANIHWRSCK
jgi:Sigma-70, region 4